MMNTFEILSRLQSGTETVVRLDEVIAEYQAHLDDYSKELGVELSIQQLIESHKLLRQRSLQSIAERNKELTEIYLRVEKQAMDTTWVKWEDLRKMTLSEIVNHVGD